MARIRTFDPNKLYHITNRTVGCQFLAKSEPKVNILLAYYLAKCQRRYKIKIYAFAFMDNHFHILVQGPGEKISKFMKLFQQSVAREINKLRNRSGHLWSGRYSAIPILDSPSTIFYLCYILLNPVKAGLCRTPTKSPGLNAAEALLNGNKYFEHRWVEESEDHPTLAGVKKEGKKRSIKIALNVLPCWRNKPAGERKVLLRSALSSHPSNIKPAIPNPRRYRPTSQPSSALLDVNTQPAPLCHASCLKVKAEYLKWRKETLRLYSEAAIQYALGKVKTAAFPRGTFPPSRQPSVKYCAPTSQPVTN